MAKQPATTIRYDRPNPSAIPFHNSLARVKAMSGPMGSGKSLAAAMEFFFMCREATVPLRGLILRETYPQLRDSTLKTLQEWFPEPMGKFLKQDKIFFLNVPTLDGGMLAHELHLRHAQTARDAQQFLSTEYSLIWLEEPVPAFQESGRIIGAGLPKEVFLVCIGRLRQAGAHRLHILLTFNPPPRHHWVYDTFFKPSQEELDRKGYALFRQPAFENEHNLRPGYYRDLIEGMSPDLARRFVRGEVVTMYPGVRVFPQCYEHVHFAENIQPMRGVELVIMFDFGLTPCFLISQVLPNGRWLILDECQLWNAGIVRLAEKLKSVVNATRYQGLKWRCWGDPAGNSPSQTDERTCFQILAAEGFPVQAGAVDFTSRREAVVQRLERHIDGEPAVLIDRNRCPMLTEALLGGYRFPQSDDGQMGSRPIKNEFSHIADAMQYGATGEFQLLTGRVNHARRLTEQRPAYDPFSRPASPRSSPGGWMSN